MKLFYFLTSAIWLLFGGLVFLQLLTTGRVDVGIYGGLLVLIGVGTVAVDQIQHLFDTSGGGK